MEQQIYCTAVVPPGLQAQTRRIIESLRLEKTSKTIKSNCSTHHHHAC